MRISIRYLIDTAEGSFLKKDFLEAFLTQSCLIEGALRDYAIFKLPAYAIKNPEIKRKITNTSLSELTDMLFLSRAIPEDLFNDLNAYRKKRNAVMHRLLKYKSHDELNEDLIRAYKMGKKMGHFIIEGVVKELEKLRARKEPQNLK